MFDGLSEAAVARFGEVEHAGHCGLNRFWVEAGHGQEALALSCIRSRELSRRAELPRLSAQGSELFAVRIEAGQRLNLAHVRIELHTRCNQTGAGVEDATAASEACRTVGGHGAGDLL